MATLRIGESPSAKVLREALAAVRRNPLPILSTETFGRRLSRLFGRSKQDAEMEARNGQEEVDAAEPPPIDLASPHEPLIVSPKYLQDSIQDSMVDLPDRSAEDVVSIVNNLAFKNVSNPSPKLAVTAKRKREGTDVVDGSPKKRAAKGSGTNGTRDEPPTNYTNVITGPRGSTSRASSEVVNVAPGKLPTRRRQKAQIHPAVQKSGDEWEVPPSPKRQVEKTVLSPTTTKTRTPPSPRATRRPRGRPTKKTTSIRKGQQRKTPNPKGKPSKSPKITSNKGQEDVVGGSEIGPRIQNQVGCEEHEEEEDERKTEGRKPGEAIDRDRQTSVQMDEGEGGGEAEEQDSDFEDHAQVDQTDEEEVEGEEELELFGQEGAWKTVLEGARSVCGSKLLLNHMPKLRTDIVKGLVNDVREARDLYEQLLPFRGIDHDSVVGLNVQLEESLDAIENQIRRLSQKNFSEKTAATKGPQMITDIFARAIPAMVFLLQSALASRVYHSDEPCDLKALNGIVRDLEEILRLQKITMLLCTIARSKKKLWQAEPAANSRPIIKPTTQKIFPKVKVMQEAFARRLSEQQRRRKAKQNEAYSRNRQNELLHSSHQAQQEARRKNEILHQRIRESREQEEEKRRNMKRTYRQFKEDDLRVERQVNGHVELKTLWSDAEDLELYFQLEKGYVGGLSTMERYSNILNTRLLQNKLPEHIRERALYFKPTLLEERGALEWISSIE